MYDSPATSKKNLNEEFQLYEKHGVKEYWIVDPENRFFRVFHLLGKYDEGTLVPPADWKEDINTIAEPDVLKGFQVNVKELFSTVG